MIRPILGAVVVAGCVGGEVKPTTDDTGTPSACAAFGETTNTSTPVLVCPGEGLPSDMIATVELRDGDGNPCGPICPVGRVVAEVFVHNPCRTDVTLDANCLLWGYSLAGPVTTGSAIYECYTTTYSGSNWVTVPTNTEISWLSIAFGTLDAGVHVGEIDLGGELDDVDLAFCLE